MTAADEWLTVDALDLEAQGVARNAEGKVVFIEGALPGETAQVTVNRRKNQWEQATLKVLGRESSQRVRPGCPHFGLHGGACGGCKMQHLEPAAQVAVKQRTLEGNLQHLAKVKPERVLRPIEGPAWGYRYRARLSVRWVAKKGTVLVGFHERKSRGRHAGLPDPARQGQRPADAAARADRQHGSARDAAADRGGAG
jgi:23S rRNA (uracil1939-C5)-methyltransferase